MSVDARVSLQLSYIAANLRAARHRRELTQQQVAASAKVDLRFLQRVEQGQNNLSVAILVALADVLRVPVASLFKKATMTKPTRGRPRKTPKKR
jgi:transcriptional regulator with XRE-family HTH domain